MEDVDCIYDYITTNQLTQKIFHDVSEIICKTICREMTLVTMPTNCLVCKQGARGDTFYIVIEGRVGLYVRDDVKTINGQRKNENGLSASAPATRQRRKSTVFHRTSRRESTTDEIDQYIEGKTIVPPDDDDDDAASSSSSSRTAEYGKLIKHLTSGATFGELAVIDPEARRSCTIITSDETHFICLTRQAYQRLTRVNATSLSSSQIEFLQSMVMFDAWPRGDLVRLSNVLRYVQLPRDTHVFHATNECTGLYFLLSGHVSEQLVLKTLVSEAGRALKCIAPDQWQTTQHHHHSGPTAKEAQEAEKAEWMRRHHRVKKKTVDICHLSPRDVFGEFATIYQRPSYEVDVKTTSDVELLVLDRHHWLELFVRDKQPLAQEAQDAFRDLANTREQWRRSRIQVSVSRSWGEYI